MRYVTSDEILRRKDTYVHSDYQSASLVSAGHIFPGPYRRDFRGVRSNPLVKLAKHRADVCVVTMTTGLVEPSPDHHAATAEDITSHA